MRLFFISCLAVIVYVNLTVGRQSKKTIISDEPKILKKLLKKEEPIIVEEVEVFYDKPIALVFHKTENTIYRCSELDYSDCGLSAKCGKYNLKCVENTTVEYLHKEE